MGATQKITCLSAIIFAFGEIWSVSIVNFRLCGGHPLSLYDESRQRRAKEREDNRSERFSSLSLESYPSFDRSRFASAHKCAGAYRHVITSWFPRHRATPGGVFAVRARGAYVFYCIKVIPAALTLQFKYPIVAGTAFSHS